MSPDQIDEYARRVAHAYPWTPERVGRVATLLRAFRSTTNDTATPPNGGDSTRSKAV